MLVIDLTDPSIPGYGKKNVENNGFTTVPQLVVDNVELSDLDSDYSGGSVSISGQKNATNNIMTVYTAVRNSGGDIASEAELAGVMLSVYIEPRGVTPVSDYEDYEPEELYFMTSFELEHGRAMYQLSSFPEGVYKFVITDTNGNDDFTISVHVSVSE